MKRLILITSCITLLMLGYTNVKVYAAPIEQSIAGIGVVLNKIDPIEIKYALDIKYQYTTERVNLRSEASINSDILITLDNRSKVEILKITSSDWTKVRYDNKVGYIYSKYLRDTELPSLDFTDEEIELMAKIMWLESRNQSDAGLAGVCLVIRNRILSTEFSDTMLEVLSDKTGRYYEFSTWKLVDTAKPDERIYEIIDETMNGLWDNLLGKDYVYFSTSPQNNHGTIKIDDHYFCRY